MRTNHAVRLAGRIALVIALLVALYAAAGFLLAPYLVGRYLPSYIEEHLGERVSVGEVSVNPFLLTAEVRDFAPQQGDSVLPRLDRLHVALAWSGLFRRTWVVSNLELDGPVLRIERLADGRLKFPPLKGGAAPGAESGRTPALLVEHAVLRDGRVTYIDRSGKTDAAVTLAPVEIELRSLATFPGQPGDYSLRARLPQSGSLASSGQFSLEPLAAHGRAQVDGLDAGVAWPFLRDRLRLAPPRGRLDFSAAYRFASGQNALSLALDDILLRVAELHLAQPGAQPVPLLQLKQAMLRNGRFDLEKRELTLPSVEFTGGKVWVTADSRGRVNWAGIAAPSADSSGPSLSIRSPSVLVKDIALAYASYSGADPIAVDVGAIDGGFRFAQGESVSIDEASLKLARLGLQLPGLREPAAVEEVAVAGAAFDSGKRAFGADSVRATGGKLALLRGGRQGGAATAKTSGRSAKGKGTRAPAPAPSARTSAEASAAWRHRLGQVILENFNIGVEDRSYGAPIAYRGAASARLGNIDSASSRPIDFAARLNVDGGGSVMLGGTLAQDASQANGEARVSGMPLVPLQPFLASQAAVRLKSGALSGLARIRYEAAENGPRLGAQGELRIADFLLAERDGGDRLVSWKQLAARGIDFSLDSKRLVVDEVEVDSPGAKLTISEDRKLNLAEVVHEKPQPAAASVTGARASPPFEARIKRVRVRNGDVDYADLSLVLPFATRIESITGTAANISTASEARAVLQAGGRIERFGSARVQGELNVAHPTDYMDIRVVFNNVQMPPLSPYTATFAGRMVSSGKLWLDLEYKIVDRELQGKNDVTLSDFTLGPRVEAPNALDLPLDLAVALLKDDQGRINLGVPVRGDLDNPRFDYGALIRDAIGSTLRRIVTAPFRFLAGLFGGGQDKEFGGIDFRPGSARLAPEEQENLTRVAEALSKRPQLKLLVSGAYDAERDAAALRTDLARRAVLQASGIAVGANESPGPIAFTDPDMQRAIERVLAKSGGSADAFKRDFQQGKARVDEAALHQAMFQRIAEMQPITGREAQALAVRRVQSIAEFLTRSAGVPSTRIESGRIENVQASDGKVTCELGVGAMEKG